MIKYYRLNHHYITRKFESPNAALHRQEIRHISTSQVDIISWCNLSTSYVRSQKLYMISRHSILYVGRFSSNAFRSDYGLNKYLCVERSLFDTFSCISRRFYASRRFSFLVVFIQLHKTRFLENSIENVISCNWIDCYVMVLKEEIEKRQNLMRFNILGVIYCLKIKSLN